MENKNPFVNKRFIAKQKTKTKDKQQQKNPMFDNVSLIWTIA